MSLRPIEFYFRGQRHQVHDVSPTTTVLQFLREQTVHKTRQTGTKEGCAEGDCGACTVVIGELQQHKLQLYSVNACIQFLPTLDRKALFTIEDLQTFLPAQTTLALHPIQQAMVECHGSQCGFCTPGIIMSLWSMYENEVEKPEKTVVSDYLSGNLCRCTGYRPILEAAAVAYDLPKVLLNKQRVEQQLLELQLLPDLTLHYHSQHYFAPTTVAQFAQLREQYPQARIVAGSTDVGLWVTKLGRELGDMLYIGQVAQLKQIAVQDNIIEIGAAVSLSEAFKVLTHYYPELTELTRRFASMPIKNSGTLAGNIANGSPIGDSMPALITLNTQLKLCKGQHSRVIALQDFYLDYQKTALQHGEFVHSILIAQTQSEANLQLACYKISKRYEQDISAVCAAFAMSCDANGLLTAVRIAFGGMAAIPKRALHTEAFLLGKQLSQQLILDAQQQLQLDYQPLNDGRATAAYRLQVAENCLLRFYLEKFAKPSSLQRLDDVIALVEV